MCPVWKCLTCFQQWLQSWLFVFVNESQHKTEYDHPSVQQVVCFFWHPCCSWTPVDSRTYWWSCVSLSHMLSCETASSNDWVFMSWLETSFKLLKLLNFPFFLLFVHHSTQVSTREDAVRHIFGPLNKEVRGPSCSVFRWCFGPQPCCWNLTGKLRKMLCFRSAF